MSAGMSVSETYRPPYAPKWPASSGSFGAADELFDLGMVLPSGTLLDARGDVHRERSERADDAGDGVGTKPAGDEEARRGEASRPGRIEREAGPPRPAGDEAVEEEIVGRIARRESGEIRTRSGADRLDRPPARPAAVLGGLVAVELERGESDPRRDLLDARALGVDEHADHRGP